MFIICRAIYVGPVAVKIIKLSVFAANILSFTKRQKPGFF